MDSSLFGLTFVELHQRTIIQRTTYDYKIPSMHEVFLFIVSFITLENRLQV